tara:strand:- start:106 stop:744 length:639 start_codon:yes stop_codon:yes gene_type:complete
VKKNILITGGSSGIGLELVKHYFKKKYNIYTSYNKSNKHLIELKKKYKNKLYFKKLNLENKASLQSYVKSLKKMSITFDILFINAIYNIKRKPFKKTNLNDFNKVFAFNFLSSIFILKNFLIVNKNKKQKIINISTLVSKKGSWGLACYGPIKAAIDNLFKCLNFEYKGNIVFKSVYLGAVNTKGYKFTNGKRRNKNIMSVEKARLKILKNL